LSNSSRFGLLAIAAVGIVGFAWWRSRAAPTASPSIGSADADAQTLRALRNAGADLTKATEVNYYLYFPTREAADRAAEASRSSVFASEVRRGGDGTNWLCLATANMVPSDSAIRAASERFQGVAASLGGEYDGWEAALTK
jgi:hypothetical protein